MGNAGNEKPAGRKKGPKPESKAWEARAASVARNFAPPVYPCGKCEQPVAEGYVCQWCGDNDPSTKKRAGGARG